MTITDVPNTTCLICGDISGRQVTCNGCQQSFCWSHMKDHQDNIQNQMENLVQNHDVLTYDWNDDSSYRRLFDQIDQWEQNSINKIQVVADLARADLRSFIKKSTNRFRKSTMKISEAIDRSQQLNNFSEIEINRWTQQLNDIQQEMQTSFHIRIKEDQQTPPITMIKIEQTAKRQLDQNKQTVKRSKTTVNNDFTDSTESNRDDRFGTVLGNAKLDGEKLVAISDNHLRSCVSGANFYSNGRHSVQFRVEEVYIPGWSCFFGMATSNEHLRKDVSDMNSIYGVWSSEYRVKCGKRFGLCGPRRWHKDDTVVLTFDCDNKQLQIENKRLKWHHIFNIDLRSCPLPWKFICIFKGCQLRIKH